MIRDEGQLRSATAIIFVHPRTQKNVRLCTLDVRQLRCEVWEEEGIRSM
jgi:hypothetical protein